MDHLAIRMPFYIEAEAHGRFAICAVVFVITTPPFVWWLLW